MWRWALPLTRENVTFYLCLGVWFLITAMVFPDCTNTQTFVSFNTCPAVKKQRWLRLPLCAAFCTPAKAVQKTYWAWSGIAQFQRSLLSAPGTCRGQLWELSVSSEHWKVAWIFNKHKLSKQQVYISLNDGFVGEWSPQCHLGALLIWDEKHRF